MKYTYNLANKIDSFKSNWFLWACVRSDGVEGTIQGDYAGNLVDETTFEPTE